MIIDLGLQSDGFTITGSGHGDTITGSSAADIIDAGLGEDTIVGFTTGDDVEGGDGSDTLTLAATSLGLNAALDSGRRHRCRRPPVQRRVQTQRRRRKRQRVAAVAALDIVPRREPDDGVRPEAPHQ